MSITANFAPDRALWFALRFAHCEADVRSLDSIKAVSLNTYVQQAIVAYLLARGYSEEALTVGRLPMCDTCLGSGWVRQVSLEPVQWSEHGPSDTAPCPDCQNVWPVD
jgi:hypothetical protein